MSHLLGSALARRSCWEVLDFTTFCCQMLKYFLVVVAFIGGFWLVGVFVGSLAGLCVSVHQ